MHHRKMFAMTLAAILIVVANGGHSSNANKTCPICCSGPAQTLSEEMAEAQVVLLATLEAVITPKKENGDDEHTMARFKIVELWKGNERLGKTAEIVTPY